MVPLKCLKPFRNPTLVAGKQQLNISASSYQIKRKYIFMITQVHNSPLSESGPVFFVISPSDKFLHHIQDASLIQLHQPTKYDQHLQVIRHTDIHSRGAFQPFRIGMLGLRRRC
jgi:hypothetical protein